MATYLSIVLLFLLSLCCIVQQTSAAAGWCYECNSNNPRCGIQIDPSKKPSTTPCNGQCYTSILKNTIYRGCSWEHGFMKEEITEITVDKKNRLWHFCDTSLCNSDATSITNEVCDRQSCDYFDYPEDCELHNLYTMCGKRCGNQMC